MLRLCHYDSHHKMKKLSHAPTNSSHLFRTSVVMALGFSGSSVVGRSSAVFCACTTQLCRKLCRCRSTSIFQVLRKPMELNLFG